MSDLTLLERLRARLPVSLQKNSEAGAQWVCKLEDCIAANLSHRQFNVTTLARQLGLSTRQLRRRVLDHFGKAPAAVLLERRLHKAHSMIKQGGCETIAEVAQAVGLSAGYFSRRYRNAYRVDGIEL